MSTDLDMQVEMIGFNTLYQALMEFPKQSTRKAILRKAHSAWGKLVQRRARQMAPRRTEPPYKRYGGDAVVKPGRLKASITSRASKKLINKPFAMVWLVYPTMSRKKKAWERRNAFYRHWVEFGFVHVSRKDKKTQVPPRPFINPAFRKTQREGSTAYKAEMVRAMAMAALKIRNGPHDVIRISSGRISGIGGLSINIPSIGQSLARIGLGF